MKGSIRRWNIWWEDPVHLKKFTGTERIALSRMKEELEIQHIKDIIGVRRCGKTVLMYQMISELIKRGVEPEKILYLNFDDPQLADMEKAITASLEMNPDISYIFLDEIQNIEGWERSIRVHYDRKKFDRIFVSGSSASLISRDVGRTLTGRHLTKVLTPFSFGEYLSAKKVDRPFDILNRERVVHHLENYLKDGGFPETLDQDSFTSKAVLVDLYNDILMRDIVSRFNADPEIVRKIGYYMMTNICSNFSFNSVGRALNLHYDTVKKYVPYFEEVFLLLVVPFFSWKIKTTLKKDLKCYAIDTGLRNAVSFKFSDDLGKLAENSVLVELKRRGKEVHFWQGKREVDFVIREGAEMTGINVTYTDDIPEREKEALLEFREKYRDSRIVLITKEAEGWDENGIMQVPLWKWLLMDPDELISLR